MSKPLTTRTEAIEKLDILTSNADARTKLTAYQQLRELLMLLLPE